MPPLIPSRIPLYNMVSSTCQYEMYLIFTELQFWKHTEYSSSSWPVCRKKKKKHHRHNGKQRWYVLVLDSSPLTATWFSSRDWYWPVKASGVTFNLFLLTKAVNHKFPLRVAHCNLFVWCSFLHCVVQEDDNLYAKYDDKHLKKMWTG